MSGERRRAERIPVGFYAQQLVDDEPVRCFTTNLSASGVYLERVLSPLDRRTNTVQIEVPLPDTGESLWTRGEVVYDCFDAFFHGSAIRFTSMARGHRSVLRDWLHERARHTFGSERVIRVAPGIEIVRPPRRPSSTFRARCSAFGLPTR